MTNHTVTKSSVLIQKRLRRASTGSFVIVVVLEALLIYTNLPIALTRTLCAVCATHQPRSPSYRCDSDITTTPIIGPNFYGIPSSTNKNESISTLEDRECRILSYYARSPLPPNSSDDDPLPFSEAKHGTQQQQQLPPTNPYWNSRTDTIQIVNKYMSRILLGCYNNTDLDNVFLDNTTRPFAIAGTSFRTGVCQRDGDYDFTTIDLLQLLYVSRQYPGSLENQVFIKIRDELLTIYGKITDNTFLIPCKVAFGPIQISVTVKNNLDTENHILQTQISRYLTNQLLLEIYPDNQQDYNNTVNGNTNWMLEYLSSVLRDYFYEYNSRPYQAFTVKALTVLHSFALDEDVVLVTEMILDIVTSFSSIQMNTLRRFVPFRRQPVYLQQAKSWEGESESYRMAVLVGNYAKESGATTTKATGPYDTPNIPVFNFINTVSTVAAKYRVQSDFLWNIVYKESDEYFISNHDTIEMYYSSKHVLISAGGTTATPNGVSLDFVNRFCIFKRCLLTDSMIRFLIGTIVEEVSNDERGWSRPTIIIPTKEHSTDMNDMIRFDGHRDPGQVPLSRNICVAPNFACGLQLRYGNIIEPNIDQCSIVVNQDWRFFDFSGSNGITSCPSYGYYMAVYNRPCTECSDKADQYGLIEISNQIRTMTFNDFQQQVLTNNPYVFPASGVQTYVTITGRAILFEINPQSDDQSQIIQVGGVDYGNPLVLERNYRSWPMVWTATRSIQAAAVKGRWTFDTSSSLSSEPQQHRRMIYDVTDPLYPKRIVSQLPALIKYPIRGTMGAETFFSRHFDDSGSVLSDDSIQYISFNYNILGVSGFQMVWRHSGLTSYHGSKRNGILHRSVQYEFAMNETITEVGISMMTLLGTTRVHRIQIVTSLNHSMIAGYGKRSEEVKYKDNNIIAFHGRADDDIILQLGVVAFDI
jgi:Jacalin-like lectin domain